MFSKYHYLNSALSRSSKQYLLTANGKEAAFLAILNFPNPKRSYLKVHRLVVLPDFQGVGLGTLFLNEIAKRSVRPFAITTSQPTLIAALIKNKDWALTRNTRNTRNKGLVSLNKTLSNKRITTTFVYLPSIDKSKKI